VSQLLDETANEVRVAGRPSSVSPYFCLYLPIGAKLHQEVSKSWAKGLRNQAGQDLRIMDTTAAAREPLPALTVGTAVSVAQVRTAGALVKTKEAEVNQTDNATTHSTTTHHHSPLTTTQAITTQAITTHHLTLHHFLCSLTLHPHLSHYQGGPRLRVGYISRRFEKYPGTQLLLRLFELHDRRKIEVRSVQ
jgi:predicted O-linked N-acetylglucosamine transferase (SPINDLY family)